MPRVVIPEDTKKLKRKINALIYQISIDINDKDRAIHKEAYKTLVEEYIKRVNR